MKKNNKQCFVQLILTGLVLCTFFLNNACMAETGIQNAVSIGSKAANLSFLTNVNILPVPKWGAVTVDIFQKVVKDNSIAKDINIIDNILRSEQPLGNVFAIAHKVRTKIESVKFSEQDRQTIKIIYDQVSDFGKYPVAVRSSATKEDLPGMSFAGLYDSFLNQKSFEEVTQSVAKCMASLFNDRAIQYYKDNKDKNIDIKSAQMGVIIQRMVNASSSGTAFSVDVATGAPCIQIAAAFGFEGVVSGAENADSFVVSPTNFKLIKLTPKTNAYSFADTSNIANAIYDHRYAQLSLSFEQVKIIAKAIVQLKRRYAEIYDGEIDTEFAVDGSGQVYLLQIRPLFLSTKATITDIDPSVDLSKVSIVARGTDSVAGVTAGKIKIIDNFDSLLSGRVKIEADDIIVTNRAENNWTQFFVNFAGIIATEGSATSHPMLIARERGVPCLIGVADAVAVLRPYDGKYVTLDGMRKCIYLGKLPLVEKSLGEAGLLFDVVQPESVPSNDDALRELRAKDRLLENSDGLWLRPIIYKLAPLLLEMYKNGIRTDEKILKEIGCHQCKSFAKNIMSIDGQIYVKWAYAPQKQIDMLKSLSVDNCEAFLAQKAKSFIEHIEVCNDFILDKQSMDLFKKTRENLISYMDLDYPISTHVTHKVHELAHNDHIPKFYLEEFSRHVQATMIDEDVKKARDAAALAADIANKYTSLGEIEIKAPLIYRKITKFAKAYKFSSSENWPVKVPLDDAYALIGKYSGYKGGFSLDKAAPVTEYFPENMELNRWARLWILLKGEQNSGHHIRVRSLWLIRDKLIAFGESLVIKGVIKNSEDILKMEFKQLVKFL